jgi:putative endonuclease
MVSIERSTNMDERCEKPGKRKKELGRRGEEAAVRYLNRCGFDILERNWECVFGEADIIAMDGCELVFIEVKTRKDISKGFPSEAIGPKKRARYERIAACYLSEFNYTDISVRFDAIAILVIADERALLRHYVNAFQAAF